MHRHGCEPLAAELSPGSAILWHANTLHRSLPSAAAEPRWTLICCYNTRHNTVDGDPYHRTALPPLPLKPQPCFAPTFALQRFVRRRELRLRKEALRVC